MKHLLLTTVAAVVLVGTAFAGPIHDAAKTGDLAGVQAELDKGVDVNAVIGTGTTPLHLACEKGQTETADLLITCLLYTSPSPRDLSTSRMPSSA